MNDSTKNAIFITAVGTIIFVTLAALVYLVFYLAYNKTKKEKTIQKVKQKNAKRPLSLAIQDSEQEPDAIQNESPSTTVISNLSDIICAQPQGRKFSISSGCFANVNRDTDLDNQLNCSFNEIISGVRATGTHLDSYLNPVHAIARMAFPRDALMQTTHDIFHPESMFITNVGHAVMASKTLASKMTPSQGGIVINRDQATSRAISHKKDGVFASLNEEFNGANRYYLCTGDSNIQNFIEKMEDGVNYNICYNHSGTHYVHILLSKTGNNISFTYSDACLDMSSNNVIYNSLVTEVKRYNNDKNTQYKLTPLVHDRKHRFVANGRRKFTEVIFAHGVWYFSYCAYHQLMTSLGISGFLEEFLGEDRKSAHNKNKRRGIEKKLIIILYTFYKHYDIYHNFELYLNGFTNVLVDIFKDVKGIDLNSELKSIYDNPKIKVLEEKQKNLIKYLINNVDSIKNVEFVENDEKYKAFIKEAQACYLEICNQLTCTLQQKYEEKLGKKIHLDGEIFKNLVEHKVRFKCTESSIDTTILMSTFVRKIIINKHSFRTEKLDELLYDANEDAMIEELIREKNATKKVLITKCLNDIKKRIDVYSKGSDRYDPELLSIIFDDDITGNFNMQSLKEFYPDLNEGDYTEIKEQMQYFKSEIYNGAIPNDYIEGTIASIFKESSLSAIEGGVAPSGAQSHIPLTTKEEFEAFIKDLYKDRYGVEKIKIEYADDKKSYTITILDTVMIGGDLTKEKVNSNPEQNALDISPMGSIIASAKG